MKNKKNWLIYQDWIRAKEDYIAEVLDIYAKILKDEGIDVPLYHNLLMLEDLAPTNYHDMSQSIWLGVNFWLGDFKNERLELFDDFDDYVTVVLRCKLLKGTQHNLPMISAETNWGWAGERYSNFLTRLTIAYELDGTNFYTLLDTNDAEGYSTEREPYPGNSPIDFDGRRRKKGKRINRLVFFLNNVGERLTHASARADICIGYYPRYNDHALYVDTLTGDERNDAWNQIKANFKDVANANWATKNLIKAFVSCDIEFDVMDIRHCEYELLEQYKALVVPTFDYMDERAQENLVNYVKNGGILICNPRVPYLDLNLGDCTIIRDELYPAPSKFEAYKENSFDVTWDRYGTVKGAWWSDSFKLSQIEGLKPLATLPNGEVCAYQRKVGKGKAIFIGTNIFVYEVNSMFYNWFFDNLEIPARKSYTHEANVEIVERVGPKSEFLFVINRNNGDTAVHARLLDVDLEHKLSLKTVLAPHSISIIEIMDGEVVSAALDSSLGASALIGHAGIICTTASHPVLNKVDDTKYLFFAERDTEVVFSKPKKWKTKSIKVYKVYSKDTKEEAEVLVNSEIRFLYESGALYYEILI